MFSRKNKAQKHHHLPSETSLTHSQGLSTPADHAAALQHPPPSQPLAQAQPFPGPTGRAAQFQQYAPQTNYGVVSSAGPMMLNGYGRGYSNGSGGSGNLGPGGYGTTGTGTGTGSGSGTGTGYNNAMQAILAYSGTPSPAPPPMGVGVPGQAELAPPLSQQPQGQYLVGDEEYNRLLKNYRLAHERIEDQRQQLLMQERLNASLRKHVSLLEGGETTDAAAAVVGTSTVDDFTIKNSSSGLERRINRFAADTLSSRDYSRNQLASAIYADLPAISQSPFLNSIQEFEDPESGIILQSLVRHALSSLLADGIVNSLLVTDSEEANEELTKLHATLFEREPLVASVWRRQTFSASLTHLSERTCFSLLSRHIPAISYLLNPSPTHLSSSLSTMLEAFHLYARTLHSSATAMGGGGGVEGSGFYRAYVPQIGTLLDPGRLELIKRCYRTERGEPERVGACLFPGLVKESAIENFPFASPEIGTAAGTSAGGGAGVRGGVGPSPNLNEGRGMGTTTSTPTTNGDSSSVGMSVSGSRNGSTPGAGGFADGGATKTRRETRIVVVRRAQVICECALAAAHTMARST
ncbi:BQ2448_7190 [Microbotryum intermedium]|uniref:BQ2448_7190 protein n=1 Tax=Microbotryum intermedium TaxID=269621 RepID=A0A238FJD2_9BASI|nr:BQ2448_7190 [Microbotryum intermedium]